MRVLTTFLFALLFNCIDAFAQNVGIGVTAPEALLHLKSDGNTTMPQLLVTQEAEDFARIRMENETHPGPYWEVRSWVNPNPDESRMILYSSLAGNIMTIRGNARVGISAFSPNEKLEVGYPGRVFIGDSGGEDRRGLLIDAVEPGDYVRIHPFDYGTGQNMHLNLATQVGIGINEPDSSALVHMYSLDKGLIIPKMPATYREAIAGPAQGLLVYQTDGPSGFWFFRGSQWHRINESNILADTDNDTKIQAEESPDEDIIRFDLGGTERWVMRGHSLEPVNTGGSVYIGENAGIASTGIDNTAIGNNALFSNTTNIGSVAIGTGALYYNGLDASEPFHSNSNTAIGSYALLTNTTGYLNTAVGSAALYNNTTGFNNVAIGALALSSNTIGIFNVAIGTSSAQYSTTASHNTSVGHLSLYLNTTGRENSAFGSGAMHSNTTGHNNAAMGYRALRNNTTGHHNIAVGDSALYSNQTASYNTAIGFQALYSNTIGYANVANGYQALHHNTTGSFNAAAGLGALFTNSIGNNNTATGYGVLYNNTTGNYNTAYGSNALYTNTTGVNNTAFGYQALYNSATDNNTAFGYQALYSNTNGWNNLASGYQALYSNTTGVFNTAYGYSALYYNNGMSNTACGYLALLNNTTGNSNVAHGRGALQANITGDYNTACGYGADVSLGNLIFATAIGANAIVGQSNSIVLGDPDQTIKVGIGTSTPTDLLTITGADPRFFIGDTTSTARRGLLIDGVEPGNYVRIHGYDYDPGVNLDINVPSDMLVGVWGGTTSYTLELAGTTGTAAKPGGGTWISTSDRRLKQDVQAYTDGLSAVMEIRPVRYRYKAETGYDTEKEFVGVVAQEIQEIAPYMVSTFAKDGNEYLAVDVSAMTYMLINAVQEQQEMIRALQEEITSLRQAGK